MNKRLELGIHLLISVLFIILMIPSPGGSSYYFDYAVTLSLLMPIVLLSNRYLISRLFLNGGKKSGFILFFIILTTGYLLASSMHSRYLLMRHDVELGAFSSYIIKENIGYFIFFYALAYLHMIRISRKVLKRIGLSLGGLIIIISSIFGIKYILDTSYDGNKDVRFIEGEFSTLTDFLQSDVFENKVVYVDMWYSSCKPCIEEFAVTQPMKEQLKNEGIEYVYLARPTSHPNSYQLFKNAIKKYNLTGWHYYMNAAFMDDTWNTLASNIENLYAAYPHYFIVKNGKITVYEAPKPSSGEEIIALLKNTN